MGITDKLDAIVSQLTEIASGTQHVPDNNELVIVLDTGETIAIWKSANDTGFKWARVK